MKNEIVISNLENKVLNKYNEAYKLYLQILYIIKNKKESTQNLGIVQIHGKLDKASKLMKSANDLIIEVVDDVDIERIKALLKRIRAKLIGNRSSELTNSSSLSSAENIYSIVLQCANDIKNWPEETKKEQYEKIFILNSIFRDFELTCSSYNDIVRSREKQFKPQEYNNYIIPASYFRS